jgi:hypothetical protein
MTPQQILLDEMGTYYIADELEISPDFTTEYAELIADSADRMRAAAGPQGLDELVALLRALRENRQHPVHDLLAKETQLSWGKKDGLFAIFQQLVDVWIAGLTGTSAPVSAPTPAKLELREVTYEYGNENNPTATFGRFIVDVSSDASLHLTHYKAGQRREWHGKQTASVWPDVLAALTMAKFPIAPSVKGQVLPHGTMTFTVSGRQMTGKVVSVQLPTGVPFDGYRELSTLMMNIVAQVSGDILGFELPPEPRLVTDVVQSPSA